MYCMCKPHCLHTSGSKQITVHNLAPGYVRGGIKCRYQKNIQPCPCLLTTCIYPKTCLLAVQQLGLWMQHYVHHWREDQKVNRTHYCLSQSPVCTSIAMVGHVNESLSLAFVFLEPRWPPCTACASLIACTRLVLSR